ncbi:MAG TPA: HAD family hydrolase [Candidatus Paceibacterota bacterium]|nr:HAD family hydrolase [Candidatus Paceibacterota bacterium]
MSSPIKLISTDFDGTIFAEFENPPIPLNLQELIGGLQSKGAKWVINTGRDLSSLMEALARSKISIQPDFLVLVEREIQIHDGVRYVGLEEWNSVCNRAHEDLFARVRADVPRITEWINARFHATVYEDPYSPFCLIAGNNGDADVINVYLEEYCRTIPNLVPVRNDVYVRFSHAAFNKGTALAELSKRMGITADEVFAAGDHLNDLPMLSKKYARWLAAPKNAVESVKSLLKSQNGFVSTLGQGYGVADALTHYISQGEM